MFHNVVFMFKACNKTPRPFHRLHLEEFRYVESPNSSTWGIGVTEDLSDDLDIERNAGHWQSDVICWRAGLRGVLKMLKLLCLRRTADNVHLQPVGPLYAEGFQCPAGPLQ